MCAFTDLVCQTQPSITGQEISFVIFRSSLIFYSGSVWLFTFNIISLSEIFLPPIHHPKLSLTLEAILITSSDRHFLLVFPIYIVSIWHFRIGSVRVGFEYPIGSIGRLDLKRVGW